MKHKIISAVMLAMLSICLIAMPVLAIGNPDETIAFGTGTTPTYKVFYDVLETGDWLVLAEGYVQYDTTPTDYDADEAYLFELIDTDNTTTLASTTLKSYGNRPISIYLTAAQVTALGLTTGTGYIIRITGNPLVFASTVGNTVTAQLSASDYVDQNLGVDSEPPSDNLLRNFLVTVMAKHIQANDDPTVDYLTIIQGYQYLSNVVNPYSTTTTNSTTTSYTVSYNATDNTTTYPTITTITTYDSSPFSGISGSDIFVEGIQAVTNMCPVAFQAGVSTVPGGTPTSTGALSDNITILSKWGQTTANGLTNLGVYLGINQTLAAAVVMMILIAMLAIYVYSRTQSGIATISLVSCSPFLGSFMALSPMALAFVIAMTIVMLVGYFFFSRGAL